MLENEFTESRGIIPARAGFTIGYVSFGQARKDHPRSRGVYTFMIPSMVMHSGSSPLARGLLECLDGLEALCGIIPARAGFTFVAP